MTRQVRLTPTGWEIYYPDWFDGGAWLPLPLTAQAALADVQALGTRCVPAWAPLQAVAS